MRLLSNMIAVGLVVGLLAVPASAATVEVQVIDNAFSPDETTINVGDTVRWVWNSFMPHNVESAPWEAIEFDSGYFTGTTATFEYTFTSAEVVDYYCDLHGFPAGGTIAGMGGQITVVPEPAGLAVMLMPALMLLARRKPTRG
jgi:plastocyanin